jgi:hypothetical protein
MHCQQAGEVWVCFGLLNASRRFPCGFEPFLGSVVHRSNRSECWPCSCVGHRSDRWCWPVWLVRAELKQLLCFALWFACIRLGGVASVQGELFVVFKLWIGGLCSLLEHSFCLGCVELLPLLKGSETCLIQVILLFSFPFAFDDLLEFLLVVSSFSLWLPKLVCCQCTHQGGDWDAVWFEDWW